MKQVALTPTRSVRIESKNVETKRSGSSTAEQNACWNSWMDSAPRIPEGLVFSICVLMSLSAIPLLGLFLLIINMVRET